MNYPKEMINFTKKKKERKTCLIENPYGNLGKS